MLNCVSHKLKLTLVSTVLFSVLHSPNMSALFFALDGSDAPSMFSSSISALSSAGVGHSSDVEGEDAFGGSSSCYLIASDDTDVNGGKFRIKLNRRYKMGRKCASGFSGWEIVFENTNENLIQCGKNIKTYNLPQMGLHGPAGRSVRPSLLTMETGWVFQRLQGLACLCILDVEL